MPSHAKIQESNSRITAATAPRVAVFTGGTQGIGKATLVKLVALGTPIKVYVIGRNGSTQDAFLDELRASNKQAELVWIEGQVSLLAETKRICAEIKKREESIDLLFLCAGYVPLGGRRDTTEGYDASIVMSFWGRALFTKSLLPLLHKASTSASSSSSSSSDTCPPRVVSIYAAGMESADIPFDDLDLKDPTNFGIFNWAKTCATMNTVYLDHLASEPANAEIVFIHNHPGQVDTGIIKKGWGEGSWGPTLMTAMEAVAGPVMWLLGKSPITAEQSGEKSLFLCTSAMFGGRGVSEEGGEKTVAATATGGRGRTLAGKERGGVFCVPEKIECTQIEEVVGKLHSNGGREKILEKADAVMKPFL